MIIPIDDEHEIIAVETKDGGSVGIRNVPSKTDVVPIGDFDNLLRIARDINELVPTSHSVRLDFASKDMARAKAEYQRILDEANGREQG